MSQDVVKNRSQESDKEEIAIGKKDESRRQPQSDKLCPQEAFPHSGFTLHTNHTHIFLQRFKHAPTECIRIC